MVVVAVVVCVGWVGGVCVGGKEGRKEGRKERDERTKDRITGKTRFSCDLCVIMLMLMLRNVSE